MMMGLTLPFFFAEMLFPAKKEKIRKEGDKVVLTSGQATWSKDTGIMKCIDKYMENFCGLYVVIHREGKQTAYRHPCNIIFLGNKTAIMVNHAHQAILKIQENLAEQKGSYIEIVITPFVGKSFSESTERFRLEEIVFETDELLSGFDMSIIKFKHCMNRAHIYNLIPPKDCLEWLLEKSNLEGLFIERTTDDYMVMVGPEIRQPVFFNVGSSLINYNGAFTFEGANYRLKDYHYTSITVKGQRKAFETEEGYCSSPGFITDERRFHCVNKGWPQAQQPWLCYFHTAAESLVPHGAPMFREMFSKWIEELQEVKTKPIIESIEENAKVYNEIITEALGIKTQSSGLELEIVVDKIDKNHLSFASMEKSFHMPVKSEIKRSKMLIEGVDVTTRYPARMGKMMVNGELIDIMSKAREPYGNNTALLNGPLVDGIIEQCMSRIMSDSSPPLHPDILDLDQCLYGDRAYNLNSVNWQSSMGFYMRLIKDHYNLDWKSKQWMIDEATGKMNEMAYTITSKLFNHFDLKLQQGERIYGINIDNIKDELLSKEKVREGKSRLFNTNDFIYLLLCKKYMGSFAGWIFENRVKNGIAIGVNPYSNDWTDIAAKIVGNSSDVIFLDHKAFDKNQLRQIMKCVIVLMNKFYGDVGSNNSRIRMILMEDILNSIHVTMKDGKLFFYSWDQGNTSGNFLTAILNSLVNWVYMYICCIYAWCLYIGKDPNTLVTVPANNVDKGFALVCLGDDVVASINKELLPGVNFNTIKQVADIYLSLTITDELKTEGDIPDFRKITDGSFLGRGFVPITHNGKLRFIAPLRDYSVIERILWIKGKQSPEIEALKVESTNLELSLKEKEKFLEKVPRYAKACKEFYGIYPNYTDFDVARNHVLTMANYQYSFDDFMLEEEYDSPDYGKFLLKLAEEQHKRGLVNIIGEGKVETCILLTSNSTHGDHLSTFSKTDASGKLKLSHF
jgi:hypothetical protein